MEPKKTRDIETCYMVSKEERRSGEKEKSHLRGRDSTPSSQKKFVTLTVTPYSVEKCLRSLPRKFTRENDINEPGMMITLLGRDGIKQQTKLHLNKVTGSMNLGNGWRYFVEANGLKMGKSFTFKLTWEDKTPVLSLCCDRGQEGFSKAVEKRSLFIDPCSKENMSKNENNKEKTRSVEREKKHGKRRVSSPSSQKEFVTLTITPYSVEKNILRLPRKFTKENEINKPGMMTLLGKDGIKHQTKLHLNKVTGIMTLGNGWKDFVKANGLKTGESFTLKLIWEGTTPVLSLCPAECSIDRGGEGECSETNQKKSLFS
uniref:B3 domain-containing protein REM13 n=1 Tax=Noccaea caerulescens TaxID=107243 RepID=A0A1J3DM53_NOCCA